MFARRLLALLLVGAGLAGCSALRVGYNQADTFLAWTADDYFDLDAMQKQDFRARIERLLKWHRNEQLPDYARFLTEMRQRGERRYTREDAAWIVDGVKARFRAIAQHGAQDAGEMLATLTPENIQALEKQFDKVNQKFVREYQLKGSADERRRARLERTLKQVRDWTGPLSAAQEERITALSNAMPHTEHLRHQDRQRRQKEFLALLQQRNDKVQFMPQVRAWLVDWEKGRSAEFEKSQADAYEKRVTLYLEVERMLTAQQRTHALQKLQGYIDDINALAARRVASN